MGLNEGKVLDGAQGALNDRSGGVLEYEGNTNSVFRRRQNHAVGSDGILQRSDGLW